MPDQPKPRDNFNYNNYKTFIYNWDWTLKNWKTFINNLFKNTIINNVPVFWCHSCVIWFYKEGKGAIDLRMRNINLIVWSFGCLLPRTWGRCGLTVGPVERQWTGNRW
jgi:hypothetical protein